MTTRCARSCMKILRFSYHTYPRFQFTTDFTECHVLFNAIHSILKLNSGDIHIWYHRTLKEKQIKKFPFYFLLSIVKFMWEVFYTFLHITWHYHRHNFYKPMFPTMVANIKTPAKKSATTNKYSVSFSGVGVSPIVVNVSVDQ